MSGGALAFMLGSWAFVLTLTAWCFRRVLQVGRLARPEGDEAGPRPSGHAGFQEVGGRTDWERNAGEGLP